jgi:hypothetical protein
MAGPGRPGRHATDEVGNVYGRLTVLRRAPGGPKAYWLCRCECGNEVIVRGQHLRHGEARSCRCLLRDSARARAEKVRGEQHPSWTGDDVGYFGAHNRVTALRGPASAHACARCGQGHDRMEWAYTGADPNERYGNPFALTKPYSPNPGFYVPLCETCHMIHDGKRAPLLSHSLD